MTNLTIDELLQQNEQEQQYNNKKIKEYNMESTQMDIKDFELIKIKLNKLNEKPIKIINKNTTKGKKLIKDTQVPTNIKQLKEVYKSYSYSKRGEMNRCYKLAIKEKGKNFRVYFSNSRYFGVCWEVKQADGSVHLRLETGQARYIIKNLTYNELRK